MIGWIKLHRKLLVSDMYQDLNAVQRDVLLQCLLAANHKPKKWEWQGKIFECKAGQFITSLDSLIKLCAKGTTIQNVRTALVKLEKWEFLTNESTKTGRLITVINWGTYQDCEDDTNKGVNKELTKSQQSSNKQLTTNKNVKNDKNEKKIHGEFENVELKDDEYEKLEKKFSTNLNTVIEKFSAYIRNKKGKPYIDHYAAILRNQDWLAPKQSNEPEYKQL